MSDSKVGQGEQGPNERGETMKVDTSKDLKKPECVNIGGGATVGQGSYRPTNSGQSG